MPSSWIPYILIFLLMLLGWNESFHSRYLRLTGNSDPETVQKADAAENDSEEPQQARTKKSQVPKASPTPAPVARPTVPASSTPSRLDSGPHPLNLNGGGLGR